MLSTAARKASNLTDTQLRKVEKDSLVGRRIWLPKLLYDLLPYFYLVSGGAALFATLRVSEWFWVIPHYLLFAAACFHLGIAVYLRRHRKSPPQSDSTD